MYPSLRCMHYLIATLREVISKLNSKIYPKIEFYKDNFIYKFVIPNSIHFIWKFKFHIFAT